MTIAYFTIQYMCVRVLLLYPIFDSSNSCFILAYSMHEHDRIAFRQCDPHYNHMSEAETCRKCYVCNLRKKSLFKNNRNFIHCFPKSNLITLPERYQLQNLKRLNCIEDGMEFGYSLFLSIFIIFSSYLTVLILYITN